MTALDQAFIKAFSQQGTPVVVAPPPARPMSEPRPSPVAPMREAAPLHASDVFGDAPATLEMPAVVAAEPASKDCSSFRVSENPTVALDAGSARLRAKIGTEPARTQPPSDASDDSPSKLEAEPDIGSWSADCWQTSFDMAQSADALGSLGLAESIVVESLCLTEPVGATEPVDTTASFTEAASAGEAEAESAGVAESPDADEPADIAEDVKPADLVSPMDLAGEALELQRRWDAITRRQSLTNNPSSPPSPFSFALRPSGDCPSPRVGENENASLDAAVSLEAETTPLNAEMETGPAEAVATSHFKPAWQVDRFTWPRICRRLMARAAGEFDRLADALLAANARGQKALALAGCSRGEGATTLLLCAARRLAERGIKLVLIDADLNRPRLAKRLGVQPQSGWNDPSEQDGTFLDPAVVEAAANNLAISPVRELSPPKGPTAADWSRFAACVETLKNHYEMVLVDLGPLESIESFGDMLGRSAAGKIDAVLLVHNPRVTSEERLAAVEQQLTDAGIALAGRIENFVST